MPEGPTVSRPRLLIEDWLPATAIGVECMRERGTGQNPPNARFHVWWARRPLAASRAAVLASVLPADFPRDVFERLMGFAGSAASVIAAHDFLASTRASGGRAPFNPHGKRSFRAEMRLQDVRDAHAAAIRAWGRTPAVLDPMAGGGSIPLESARLGLKTLANEYNAVACSILEATLDYALRLGPRVADRTRHWGRIWEKRAAGKLVRFFPPEVGAAVHDYLFARTVPCPTTGHATPLVPDWHLLKPKGGVAIVAVPVVDKKAGTWTTDIRPVEFGPGHVKEPPRRTYANGKGISLFTGESIPADWIKAKAQAGEMGSALYAVALKTPQGLKFRPPRQEDLDALAAAEERLRQLRGDWEARNLIPTEAIPDGSKTREPLQRGMRRWADMFSPRQLLGFGTLMEELHALRPAIIAAEGEDMGEAVVHLLAFVLDKLANWNGILSSWNVRAQTVRSLFDRHDFAFKTTFSEMTLTGPGSGIAWALDSAANAHRELATLPRAEGASPVHPTQGSATSLIEVADSSIEAIVVDPPYADNVQYSELADFFYVWLKRSQGYRRPEWFSSLLCENSGEAVKNDARYRAPGMKAKEAAALAQARYRQLMTETFLEARRVLRPDGVLTVMFTHKKQEAWEALFSSLIEAGFTISATWPVKTEGAHSLHQAKKNAAQSTVILVSRVREAHAGIGYFDLAMQAQIRQVAEATAARLEKEGLNPVDQLVGSFGPAMGVFSKFSSVRLDTGDPVLVGRAIDIAADAVANWRIRKLAAGGLSGVEPEAQFALLCWDTLGAGEFRFNEAKLLGHAVGMDVNALEQAGLITVTQDKVNILSAAERRRSEPLSEEKARLLLFGPGIGNGKKRVKKADALKIHPRDPAFRTVLDKAQALALAYADAGGGAGGIGAARSFALKQQINAGDATVRLIAALLKAAPLAVRTAKGSAAAKFPEFRAWHGLLQPLFGIAPPDWTIKQPDQGSLALRGRSEGEADEPESEEDEGPEDEQRDDEC